MKATQDAAITVSTNFWTISRLPVYWPVAITFFNSVVMRL